MTDTVTDWISATGGALGTALGLASLYLHWRTDRKAKERAVSVTLVQAETHEWKCRVDFTPEGAAEQLTVRIEALTPGVEMVDGPAMDLAKTIQREPRSVTERRLTHHESSPSVVSADFGLAVSRNTQAVWLNIIIRSSARSILKRKIPVARSPA